MSLRTLTETSHSELSDFSPLEEDFPLIRVRDLPAILPNTFASGIVGDGIPFSIMMRLPGTICGVPSADFVNFLLKTDDYITFYFDSKTPTFEDETKIATFLFTNENKVFVSINDTFVERTTPLNQIDILNFKNTNFLESNFLNSGTSYQSIFFLSFTSPPTIEGHGGSGYFTSTSGDSSLPAGVIVNQLYFYPFPRSGWKYASLTPFSGISTLVDWVNNPSRFKTSPGWLLSTNENLFTNPQEAINGWWYNTPSGCSSFGGCTLSGEECFYNDLISRDASVTTPYACYNPKEYHSGKEGKIGILGFEGALGLPNFPGIQGEIGLPGGESNRDSHVIDSKWYLTLILCILLFVISLIFYFYFYSFNLRVIERVGVITL